MVIFIILQIIDHLIDVMVNYNTSIFFNDDFDT